MLQSPINLMIPFIDFGGSGSPLFFAHANGYPPEAYGLLLTTLASRYHVRAIQFRPLWSGSHPEGLRDWHPFVEDVLHWMKESGEPQGIGVGHSLGAIATLAAALRRPELFHAVVLLDPVLFHQRLLFFWRLFQKLGLAHWVHPLIPGAKRRRRVFANKAEMFARYRQKATFARLSDPALQAYVDAMARPRADGQVDLAYLPEWEVAVYAHGPLDLWRHLRELRPPLLIVRGEHSDTFHPPAVRQVLARLPGAKIITVPNTGHLVPMEQPEEVARLIHDFLEDPGNWINRDE